MRALNLATFTLGLVALAFGLYNGIVDVEWAFEHGGYLQRGLVQACIALGTVMVWRGARGVLED